MPRTHNTVPAKEWLAPSSGNFALRISKFALPNFAFRISKFSLPNFAFRISKFAFPFRISHFAFRISHFAFLLFLVLLFAGTITKAEDGYRLWLRYDPLPKQVIDTYRPRIRSLVVPRGSATLDAI